MSTKSKKSSTTGVRYSDDQKKEIVDFVISYNTEHGRGGQSEASKKFKVTPLTISTWIKSLGKKADATPKKKITAPKAKKTAGVSKKGVRYTPDEKQEVVDFVSDYNATNGRGGQSQAAKKFNLSILTVSSWLKKAGSKGAKAAKASKAVVAAVKPEKAAKVAAPDGLAAKVAAPDGLAAKVASLVAINKLVTATEKELEKLYAKQDAVMASFK